MNYKAILFNGYGVLVNRYHNYPYILNDFLHEVGYNRNTHSVRPAHEILLTNEYSLFDWVKALRINIQNKKEIITKYTQKIQEEIFFHTKTLKQTVECLKLLHSKNITILSLSNCSLLEAQIFSQNIVCEYITRKYFSCYLGYLKPDPKAFYAVLDRAKRYVDDTVMIGCRIKDDICGARNIGMEHYLCGKPSNLHYILYESNFISKDEYLKIDSLGFVPYISNSIK